MDTEAKARKLAGAQKFGEEGKLGLNSQVCFVWFQTIQARYMKFKIALVPPWLAIIILLLLFTILRKNPFLQSFLKYYLNICI